jgi:arginase
MTAVTVLGVPSSAGAYGVGLERAPDALREAGLLDALRRRGIEVRDAGDLPVRQFRPDPAHRKQQNLESVVEVVQDVERRVRDIRTDDSLLLVIGGDCTITLGVVSALAADQPDVALAYFDGDIDLSTPLTTRSGILDAMGIAHMLALEGTAPQLSGIGCRTPLMPGKRIALIGYEDDDLDDDWRTIIRTHELALFPASKLREQPVATATDALAALAESSSLIVHFDVDAVDSTDLPLALYPHFNAGSSRDQAAACLKVLCSSPKLAALVVTEVNPCRDPDGIYLRLLAASLAEAIPEEQPARQRSGPDDSRHAFRATGTARRVACASD